MTQAVILKAQELAQEIARSPEYIAMRAAEDAASQDEAIVAAVAHYNELHQQIEDISLQESPDFDQMGALTREIEAVQEEIQALPLAAAMRAARQDFTSMMQAVNAELSKLLSPGGASSCSGDCHSCGGCCH